MRFEIMKTDRKSKKFNDGCYYYYVQGWSNDRSLETDRSRELCRGDAIINSYYY